MSRARAKPGVILSVRVDPELHRQVADAARERDVSQAWLVARALEEFLPRLIPVAEIVWTRRPE
jgi:predicted transcriptional regulator